MIFKAHLDLQGFAIIPFSNPTYRIDVDGRVMCQEGKPVTITLDANNEKVVTLPLWDGYRKYKVAILVALVFKPNFIGVEKWNKLDVLYFDNDKNNTNAANLMWSFGGGVACDKYPGYNYVPFYTRYAINKQGEAIDLVTDKSLVFKLVNKGYYAASVFCDLLRWSIIHRHRMIGLAWLTYTGVVGKLQVNHIDNVNGNDLYDNLEWVTNKGNSIHRTNQYAKLLEIPVDYNRKVHGKCDATGEIKTYPNISNCAQENGLNINSVHYRCYINTKCAYPDLKQYRYEGSDLDWVEQSEYEVLNLKYTIQNQIEVRNVKTGDWWWFKTPRDAAVFLKTEYNTFLKQLAKNQQIVYPGYFQAKKKTEFISWRQPNDLERENAEATYGSRVLCRNVKTNEIVEYESASQCGRALGLNEITVAARLRLGPQNVFSGNLQFKLKSDPTPWRHVKDPEKELERYKIPVKVYLRDIFTKEVFKYDSIGDASKAKNIGVHDLINRKNRNENKPWFNYDVKFNYSDWPEYSEQDLEMFRLAISRTKVFKGRGFKVTDIRTGESKLYTDRDAVMEDHVINRSYICALAKVDGIFNNKWQFSYYFNSDKVDQSVRNNRLKTPIELLETPESSVTTTEHESADVNV